MDVNRAAEAQLDVERKDGAAIKALLQEKPDVLDLSRVAEAQLDTERMDAARGPPVGTTERRGHEPSGARVRAELPHAPRERVA